MREKRERERERGGYMVISVGWGFGLHFVMKGSFKSCGRMSEGKRAFELMRGGSELSV